MSLLRPKLVFGVGLTIAGLLLVSLAQEMNRRWQIHQEIQQLEASVRQAEKSTAELQNLNRYFQTDDFQERLAREKLNFKAPGEKVILIPHEDVDVGGNIVAPAESKRPVSNLESWWKILFVDDVS